ncbi:DUF3455 domain-containing protein [Granulicella tundricola]|uniref:DUF3455 domain-containing protein n=1 Tax=Granulicella tundricola (strain ATCC BAA-1859 / DSM 23138 / MP5ACTX9) TaxID=1198114 RepID=E8X4L5_GRATM|nr:DUF3455 domain-containing protein [Granulicella tundricola]ADW69425.1 hypothetical protein AciX9_2388 [Granulicella tundricola MP5ACTX9]
MIRFVTTCVLSLSGVAALGQSGAQSVDVPAGFHAVLTAEGRGVQIYKCQKKDAGMAWVFVAPEAKLFVDGVEVGSHGAGPVWMYKDGSSVHGKVVSNMSSPVAGAVPWLLLKGVDAAGAGEMAGVAYIRRSETKGGVARVDGCDVAHEGAESRVPYTATYSFYAAGS